jgi:hypothetical protein
MVPLERVMGTDDSSQVNLGRGYSLSLVHMSYIIENMRSAMNLSIEFAKVPIHLFSSIIL